MPIVEGPLGHVLRQIMFNQVLIMDHLLQQNYSVTMAKCINESQRINGAYLPAPLDDKSKG